MQQSSLVKNYYIYTHNAAMKKLNIKDYACSRAVKSDEESRLKFIIKSAKNYYTFKDFYLGVVSRAFHEQVKVLSHNSNIVLTKNAIKFP